MKVSFIATVYNEQNTVKLLLKSLFSQTKFPDEIIIVDGGSTDKTISEISSFKFPNSHKKANIKLIFKKGNRSVGRNEAIKRAKSGIIACSDAGCILKNDWIEQITEPFKKSDTEVVSGYYEGKPLTAFQKCLIPYFLVMPDRINPDNFLPAARSMAFKKSIWRKAKGFDEKYSHNEDYVFAKKLRKMKTKVVFNKNAIVYWMPMENLKQAWTAFYRFSFGDAQAGIFRPKVALIFLRYVLGFYILVLYLTTGITFFLNILITLFTLYTVWTIVKNYKYVKNKACFYFLPAIQFISDIAVMSGTSIGIFY